MNEITYPFYTPETKDLFTALAKAHTKFKPAELDSHGNYGSFASFESLRTATKDALCEYGLSVTQIPGYEDGTDLLYTTLAHSSGQYYTSRIALRTAGPDMQKLGAAITYARRYSYAAILGLMDASDDDGQSNADSFQKKEGNQMKSFNKPFDPNRDLGTGEPSEAQLRLVLTFKQQNKAAFDQGCIELKINPDLSDLNKTTASQLISRLKGEK